MDNSTLVLLGIYHGQANPNHISISDIDKIMDMGNKFNDRHGDTDWEDSNTDWADSVALWYNDTKDKNWDAIAMVDNDPYAKMKAEMGQYLSNDGSEYDKVITLLKKALKSKKKRGDFIDHIDGIEVWEKVQMEFTVEYFCDLIGLTNN